MPSPVWSRSFGRPAAAEDSAKPIAKAALALVNPRYGVEIGCRWHPGVIHRFDSETGEFELVNSTMESKAEQYAQAMLLGKLTPRLARKLDAIRRLRSSK